MDRVGNHFVGLEAGKKAMGGWVMKRNEGLSPKKKYLESKFYIVVFRFLSCFALFLKFDRNDAISTRNPTAFG